MSMASIEQADPINALLRRADTGDRQAIAALRGEGAAAPALWREFGDIAWQERAKLVGKIAGQNAIVAEGVSREVATLRRAWVGEHPTPLETALGERIATNWLYLHYIEAQYLQALGALTWEEDERHRKRVEQAERRYLRAIRELAQVRTIQRVTVQVNVGEQQVIIGG